LRSGRLAGQLPVLLGKVVFLYLADVEIVVFCTWLLLFWILLITYLIRELIHIIGIGREKTSKFFGHASNRLYQAGFKLLLFEMSNELFKGLVPEARFGLPIDPLATVNSGAPVTAGNIDKNPVLPVGLVHAEGMKDLLGTFQRIAADGILNMDTDLSGGPVFSITNGVNDLLFLIGCQ